MFAKLIILFVSTLFGLTAASSSSTGNDDLDYVGFHTVATMPHKLSDSVAVTFQENIFNDDNGPRIYLTGGCITNQYCTVVNKTDDALSCMCEGITNATTYFIPEKLEWFHVQSMLQERYRHMSAKVGNYLYVAGGRALNDSLILMIEQYNPITNEWNNMWMWPNTSTATSDGVAFGAGNLLYIAGGYDSMYNSPGYLYSVDVTTGHWNQLASMKKGRGDIEVAEFHGRFYVAGGWNSNNGFAQPYADVEYYSVETNTWTLVASMSLARGDFVLAVMANSIFAVGGETRPLNDTSYTHSIPVKYAERYIYENNSWIQEESIPDNLFRFVGASYNSSTDVYSSAIYLFGGQGTLNTSALYYPLRDYTIKYIPASTVQSSSNNPLSPGGIAGIVIAGIVVLIAIVVGCLIAGGYFVHKQYYTELNDTDEHRHPHTPVASLEPGNDIDLENLDMTEAFPMSSTTTQEKQMTVRTNEMIAF